MFIYIMLIYYIYLYKYVVFEQLKPKKTYKLLENPRRPVGLTSSNHHRWTMDDYGFEGASLAESHG